jgi:tetratricopeptide (TPR) repeat protein
MQLDDERNLLTTNPMTLDSDSTAPPASPASRGRWLVVAIAIGLVIVPWLWTAIPAEIGRWYCAAAAEAELEDQTAHALQRMDQAIEWSPHDANFYSYRASLKLKSKDLNGALEDANRAVALAGEASIYPLYQRVLVYQRRSDHSHALKDVERLVELASDGRQTQVLPTGEPLALDYDQALNLRAYARALAQQEIELGLLDIEQAFQRAGTEEIAAYLDTRGYLFYLAGDFAVAEHDMQRAVELAEEAMQQFKSALDGRVAKLSGRDARLWQRQRRALQENLAVMLQHRGLVHEALQRTEQASDDFRRAQQFGYSPEDGVW